MPVTPRIGFILVCIFLDALGIGLIVPVLPRLIGELAVTRDLQTTWYGAIMLSYGVMQFLSAPLLGALSDRIGRRPVLLGGILGLGLMFAVPAFSSSLWFILGSRILGGMLSANMTVAQAYIADVTVGVQRFSGFGKIGAVFGIGFVLGPALGGVLGQFDVRFPFMCAAVICLANFLYGAFVLPESLKTRDTAPLSLKRNNPFAAVWALIRMPQNRLLVTVLTLSSLATGVLQCTWALYTEYRYGFTPLLIGLSVFALGLSISFVQGWLLPRLVIRLTPRKIVFTALAAGTAALAVVALTGNGFVAALFCCLYAVSGAAGPMITGDISRRTAPEHQGTTIGAVSSLNSLTGAVAPAIGTPLLMFPANAPAAFTAGMPYFACALVMGLSLIAAAAVKDTEEIPPYVGDDTGETD